MTAETEVNAQAWSIPTEAYLSPEYARAKAFRDGAATADLIVIEGYDG